MPIPDYQSLMLPVLEVASKSLVKRREMGDAQRIGEAELCVSGLGRRGEAANGRSSGKLLDRLGINKRYVCSHDIQIEIHILGVLVAHRSGYIHTMDLASAKNGSNSVVCPIISWYRY